MSDNTRWSSDTNFGLGLMSYTVGLMNFRNAASELTTMETKGASIIILIFISIFIIFPLVFMELNLGQYSGKSTIVVWDCNPIFRGVGISNCIIFLIFQVFYNVLNTYILLFTIKTMENSGEWENCDAKWAKINCYTYKKNYTYRTNCNQKYSVEYCNNLTWQTSTEQFWMYRVLNVSEEPETLKNFQLELIFYGLATTGLVLLITSRGIKSIEKTLWIFHIIPITITTVVLCSFLTNPGGINGLKDALKPNFKQLFNLNYWHRTMMVCIQSVGLGFGAYTTFGSQSQFRSSLYMKTIAVVIVDAFITFFSYLIISSILGILAYHTNESFELTLTQNESMLFSIIPQAMFFMPANLVWIIMFYLGIFILTLRNQVMMVCIDCEIFFNYFPKLRRQQFMVSFLFCSLIFALSILCYGQNGAYILAAIDETITDRAMALLIALETFGIIYIYGLNNFLDDSHFMLGIKPLTLWKLWYRIIPIILGIVFVHFTHAYYKDHYALNSDYINIICQVLTWLPLALSFLCAVIYMIKKRCKKIFKPSPLWGPSDPSLRKSRQMFSAHSMTKEYLYRQERLKSLEEDEVPLS